MTTAYRPPTVIATGGATRQHTVMCAEMVAHDQKIIVAATRAI